PNGQLRRVEIPKPNGAKLIIEPFTLDVLMPTMGATDGAGGEPDSLHTTARRSDAPQVVLGLDIIVAGKLLVIAGRERIQLPQHPFAPAYDRQRALGIVSENRILLEDGRQPLARPGVGPAFCGGADRRPGCIAERAGHDSRTAARRR